MDGKEVGCFRVHAHGSIRIERPANDTGCFTFYRADSAEGEQAGAGSIARDERGLVQAQFRFAKQAPQAVRTMSMTPKSSYGSEEKTSGGFGMMRGFGGEAKGAAGVTGLSGESSQQFVQVSELNYDPALDVNITVRLVADVAVRELKSVERSNPIPSAME